MVKWFFGWYVTKDDALHGSISMKLQLGFRKYKEGERRGRSEEEDEEEEETGEGG